MAKSSKTEMLFCALVHSGMFLVNADGEIWRLSNSKFDQRRPCPRRAEIGNPNGYLYVRFRVGKKRRRQILAHRAIYAYFNGFIHPEMQINHKNGVKRDNRPSNLELVTPLQNMRHALANGFLQTGERHHAAKLTDKEVATIRELYASGEHTQYSLAIRYGCKQSFISQLVLRKTRRYVDCQPDAAQPDTTDLHARHCSESATGRHRDANGRFLKVAS